MSKDRPRPVYPDFSEDDIQEGSGSTSMAEVTLTDEEPFVNQNDFNAIDRNRNCSLVCNKIPEGCNFLRF